MGSREVVDGRNIAALFVSTPEAREKYEQLEKILSKEVEEEEERKPWE